MFGLMKPFRPDLDYLSLYSRCCQHQRQLCGILTLPSLSYESVFLYASGLDAMKFPSSSIPSQRCCRLRRGKTLLHDADAGIGQFSSAVSVLLADIKLQDDIRDEGSLLARSMRRLLRNSVSKARDYICQINSESLKLIDKEIKFHLELENSQEVVRLNNYLLPTANAFGTLFEMVPAPDLNSGSTHSLFTIGFHLGAAILAVDCFFDWESDLRRGSYNPVHNGVEAVDAAEIALHHLSLVVAECEFCMGHDSRSSQLARTVFSTLAKKVQQVAGCEALSFSAINDMPHNTKEQIHMEHDDFCLRIARKVGSRGICELKCHK
jgi:hypothetical protein